VTEKYAIQTFQGTIFDYPDIGKHDVVILSHILEHIYDLKGAILKLKALLSANGYLYIEVPDAMRYGDYLNSPLQDFNIEHINHFSGNSLVNLCSSLLLNKIDLTSRVFQAPEGVYNPAISSIWKSDGKLPKVEITRDTHLKRSIANYISKSLDQFGNIEKQLAKHLKEHTQFIIWGTGQLAFKLLNYTCLKNAEIVAFVDNNPVNQGKRLRGVPIVPPSAIATNSPVIITSLIHEAEIKKQIQQMRITNPIISLEL